MWLHEITFYRKHPIVSTPRTSLKCPPVTVTSRYFCLSSTPDSNSDHFLKESDGNIVAESSNS